MYCSGLDMPPLETLENSPTTSGRGSPYHVAFAWNGAQGPYCPLSVAYLQVIGKPCCARVCEHGATQHAVRPRGRDSRVHFVEAEVCLLLAHARCRG